MEKGFFLINFDYVIPLEITKNCDVKHAELCSAWNKITFHYYKIQAQQNFNGSSNSSSILF